MIKNHLQSHEFMMFSVVLVFAVIGLMMNYPASITGYSPSSGVHGQLKSGGSGGGVFGARHGGEGVLKDVVVRSYQEKCIDNRILDVVKCDQILKCLEKNNPIEGEECDFIALELQLLSIVAMEEEEHQEEQGLTRPEGLGGSFRREYK